MEWTVRDAMTVDAPTIPVNATPADAEQQLLAGEWPELFVVDAEGFLVGVLPDYVLLKQRLSEVDLPKEITSMMTRRFLVIGPDSSLAAAARYLRDHLHPRLAVVDSGRLIGIVTRTNVLRRLASSDDSLDEAAA